MGQVASFVSVVFVWPSFRAGMCNAEKNAHPSMQLPVRLPRLFPLFSLFFPFESTHPSLEGHFYSRKEEEKDTSILKKKKKIYLVWKNVSKENDSLSGKKNVRKACLRATRKVEERRVLFPRNLESNVNRFPPRLIITPREGQRPRARHCATSRRRVVGAAQAANSF